VKQYRVRYLSEATDALRSTFLYIRDESGPDRAADWLAGVYASIDDLETAPRATQEEGVFYGREFRSKLVISHRVFFTIDEAAQVVYVIDVIHTARQTKLEEYRDDG
jgi:plasmid stabilization system protein ParE